MAALLEAVFEKALSVTRYGGCRSGSECRMVTYYLPPTIHRPLLTTHYSPPHYSQPTTHHYSPLTTHYSLLTTHHYSPLTTHHYSPLTTHHPLLTTHYSPLLHYFTIHTSLPDDCRRDLTSETMLRTGSKVGLEELRWRLAARDGLGKLLEESEWSGVGAVE